MPASTNAVERAVAIVSDPQERVGFTDDEGLASLVGRTVEDTRSLVSAEIALFKARIAERTAAYRGAIVLFAIAGVLALCGFIALLVGLILSLATLIGPGLATAAVVLGVFAVASVLAVIGKGRLAPPDLSRRS